LWIGSRLGAAFSIPAGFLFSSAFSWYSTMPLLYRFFGVFCEASRLGFAVDSLTRSAMPISVSNDREEFFAAHLWRLPCGLLGLLVFKLGRIFGRVWG